MIFVLFGNMVRCDLARRDGTVLSDAEDPSIKCIFQIFEVGITIFWQYDEISVEI